MIWHMYEFRTVAQPEIVAGFPAISRSDLFDIESIWTITMAVLHDPNSKAKAASSLEFRAHLHATV